jgi:hypothetical protein
MRGRGWCRQQRVGTVYLRASILRWRRQALDGRLVDADEIVRFASAVVDDNGSLRSPSLPEFAAAAANLSAQACPTVALGRIEIVLVGGHRVFIDNGVDTTVLARVAAE